MKKIAYFCMAMLVSPVWAQSQPSKQPINPKAGIHQAKFTVNDYTTHKPIPYAVITSQDGFEVGVTDVRGDLTAQVPQNAKIYYTISAEGFNPMNIRLTQAEKKSGKYEVYLPSAERGYHKAAEPIFMANEAMPEMMKVYVKEDPSMYQMKMPQGGDLAFSVQVAASSNSVSEAAAKREWQDLGQVYIKHENGMYKTRIGPFSTQQEAKQVLQAVKSKGRKDAFIVVQHGGEYDAPLSKSAITHQEATTQPNTAPQIEAGEYKVRVASYLHPGGFNPNGIDKIGKLESYRRGEWTIMMIGGFTSVEDARRAKDLVISKGFKDAAIVKDDNGILISVEEY